MFKKRRLQVTHTDTQTFYNASSISLFAGYMSSLAHAYIHTYTVMWNICAHIHICIYIAVSAWDFMPVAHGCPLWFLRSTVERDNEWRGVLRINWSTHKSRQPLISPTLLLLLALGTVFTFSVDYQKLYSALSPENGHANWLAGAALYLHIWTQAVYIVYIAVTVCVCVYIALHGRVECVQMAVVGA